jgi:hypothetical protein
MELESLRCFKQERDGVDPTEGIKAPPRDYRSTEGRLPGQGVSKYFIQILQKRPAKNRLKNRVPNSCKQKKVVIPGTNRASNCLFFQIIQLRRFMKGLMIARL